MAWTLGQLRTFVAVAELGSMTRAAEHLGYSVGAVSQHITALRRVVDSDLFLRRGRGLVLAEAGRTLLPRARNILAAQKQAEMAMLGRDFRSEAIVTLGVFGAASTTALPQVVRRLGKRHPDIEVRARETDGDTMRPGDAPGHLGAGDHREGDAYRHRHRRRPRPGRDRAGTDPGEPDHDVLGRGRRRTPPRRRGGRPGDHRPDLPGAERAGARRRRG